MERICNTILKSILREIEASPEIFRLFLGSLGVDDSHASLLQRHLINPELKVVIKSSLQPYQSPLPDMHLSQIYLNEAIVARYTSLFETDEMSAAREKAITSYWMAICGIIVDALGHQLTTLLHVVHPSFRNSNKDPGAALQAACWGDELVAPTRGPDNIVSIRFTRDDNISSWLPTDILLERWTAGYCLGHFPADCFSPSWSARQSLEGAGEFYLLDMASLNGTRSSVYSEFLLDPLQHLLYLPLGRVRTINCGNKYRPKPARLMGKMMERIVMFDFEKEMELRKEDYESFRKAKRNVDDPEWMNTRIL
jgi:hypothetical protein